VGDRIERDRVRERYVQGKFMGQQDTERRLGAVASSGSGDGRKVRVAGGSGTDGSSATVRVVVRTGRALVLLREGVVDGEIVQQVENGSSSSLGVQDNKRSCRAQVGGRARERLHRGNTVGRRVAVPAVMPRSAQSIFLPMVRAASVVFGQRRHRAEAWKGEGPPQDAV
jgi:hypothetical protein